MTTRWCVLCVLAIFAAPAHASENPPTDRLDRFLAAYPETVSDRVGDTLILRDGTRLNGGTGDPNKPFAALLSNATLRDQLRLVYPQGTPAAPPPVDFDPGRFRNAAFFNAMYGDCHKGGVEKNLVSITWLPKHSGQLLAFTRVNGAADRLREVSAEIDALPDAVAMAAFPSAGTYACRGVADAGQPSMHAYGAAIDLNLKVSNYWLWDAGNAKSIPWRNRMPQQIVDIFERHGFIWGGRWYHYDTMHFEYRPELLQSTTH